MLRDAQDHALSGATPDALGPYEAAIRSLTLMHGDPIARFDAAIAAAPDFAMARIGKAWALVLPNDPLTRAMVEALLDTIRPLPLNAREAAHLAALAICDGPAMRTQRRLASHLANTTSLLWRLHVLGHDTGARWRELAALWEGHADGTAVPFTDIHAAMAELASGQETRCEARLAAMRAIATDGGEMAQPYRTVVVPVVEALAAFHRGAHAEAVERLLPLRADLWQMGGSHAQRDVIEWTLLEAATRAGLRDVALALAHERLASRPRSATNRRWIQAARALPD